MDPVTRQFLFSKFGTCIRSFLSMFEITMAPGAFVAYRRLYDEVSPMLSIFFVAYGVIVTFAVVRVITAMFLKNTLSANKEEDEFDARIKEKQLERFAELLMKAVKK